MKRWLASLPKANLGETARLLYQAMQELNRLRVSTQVRMHLLELFRPEIHYVCRQLERYVLGQPIVLGERPRKVASLCQALHYHLASGYKLVVVELRAQSSLDRDQLQLLASALQRAIHGLCAILVRSYQLYSPAPSGLWLELHQLYLIATEHALQDMPVRDELACRAQELSATQSYIVALMLGCGRCNQLRRQSIGQLAEALESWSGFVRLQQQIMPDTPFGVSPMSDRPPRYLSQFTPSERAPLLAIDPRGLVQHIQQYLKLKSENPAQPALPEAEGLDVDLLQHVCLTWGDIAERSFERTPGTGRLSICIGMSALHYHLAGERVFGDVLKRRDTCTSAKFKLNNGAPDIWATAFDAQIVSDEFGLTHERIEFVRPASPASNSETDKPFSTFEIDLINHSPGGFCLSWSDNVSNQLQAGELLGLREPDSTEWSIAVVRWIRQVRGGGLHMGVEIIAPHAEPCGLKLLRKVDNGSAYLRALLLPANNARPACVITPRLPFQEGQKVMINQNGDEQRAALRYRQMRIGGYNQFEYQVVGLPEDEPETAITALRSDGACRAEDFDSLWKSL